MRKGQFSLAVLGLATICGRRVVIAQTPAPAAPRTVSGRQAKVSAFVLLLQLRWELFAKWKETGVWPADPETDKALDGHAEYWAKQLKDGRAILAGAMGGDLLGQCRADHL